MHRGWPSSLFQRPASGVQPVPPRLVRASGTGMSSDMEGRHRGVDVRGRIAIAMLGAMSAATSLVNGFAYDDRLLILSNPRVHHLAHIGRVWGQTYWPPWMGAGLYRPLTMSAFVVEWSIGGGAPWMFHATNLMLYIAACLLFY